jgi:hypothetical protein
MKIIWVIGVMCSGKTTFSLEYGKKINKIPFHLDHIRQGVPLIQAYKEAIQTGLIEGYTPHRNTEHLKAITEALEGYEVEYILIKPPYEQWKENCKPIIACPTDENPPDYTKEEYEAENERLKNITKPILII